MNILQTPIFKRKFKKLSPNQKKSVKDNVLKISKDHSIGVMKKGDLSDVRVHKFKILGQEFLHFQFHLPLNGSFHDFCRGFRSQRSDYILLRFVLPHRAFPFLFEGLRH